MKKAQLLCLESTTYAKYAKAYAKTNASAEEPVADRSRARFKAALIGFETYQLLSFPTSYGQRAVSPMVFILCGVIHASHETPLEQLQTLFQRFESVKLTSSSCDNLYDNVCFRNAELVKEIKKNVAKGLGPQLASLMENSDPIYSAHGSFHGCLQMRVEG
ncbi:hypothetical protein L596_004274 [Steinernema carpocapsae]|uniref:Uncharacterized protein n=1 Tax=Steinernema carpocapsae TaxID=34508 RepID=A0A4U8UV82_STECR|nr:hypothetical protein L596_004274 [Steinernema carpocapsae]